MQAPFPLTQGVTLSDPESAADSVRLRQTIAELDVPLTEAETAELATALQSTASLSKIIHSPEAQRLLAE